MFNRILFSAAVLSILLACNVQGEVYHSTWVGGCCNGYWDDANNWYPKIVPDNDGENTFDVTIDANNNYVDVILYKDRTVNRLDCYSADQYDIDLGGNGITLTLATSDGLANYGNLNIADLGFVVVDIDGNVRNYKNLEFDGHIDIDGDLLNFEKAELEISTGETSAEGGQLVNAGTVTICSLRTFATEPEYINSGHIQINGGAYGAEILRNMSTGTVRGFGSLEAEQLLNEGNISAAGGVLSVHIDNPMTNTGTLRNEPIASLNIIHAGQSGNMKNLGMINVGTGGGVAFDCNLVNEPNGVIKLFGGALSATMITQKADATLQGFGGITGDIVIGPDGIIKLTGPTNIVGDVEIDPNATLEVSDGLTLITGQTTCNGTIHIKGGYLIPQGGLSGNCNVIWEPGLYTNVADFNLDGQVNLKDFAYFADVWLWQTAWR